MNYKLLIQYDGTDFHGWQIQGHERTVQGELQRVLSLIEDAEVHVAGSGRTDAGVHAEGQTASFKLHRSFTPEKLRGAINGNLWRDVRVLSVEKMPDDFHARFSAKGKTYVYRIINAPVISPFWVRYAHHESRPLEVSRMREAARFFLGEHDWTAFSSANSDSENKVRTNPLAALANRALGQADDRECGKPRRDVDLHANGKGVDSADGAGEDSCEHG
jgi:tRNA pseudouridine38-40 synthase